MLAILLGSCWTCAATGVLALEITPTGDSQALVDAILGPGITQVGTPTRVGFPEQSGIFTNGAAEIGFDAGIVLSSGNVSDFPGANEALVETRGGEEAGADLNTDFGLPGDPMLDSLAGFPTFDASILSFGFQFGDGSVGGDLFFDFVFASEEYIDFIGSEFNDVFGFFLDGVNIALIAGSPISVNTINDVQNSAHFINNVTNAEGIPVAGLQIRFDGLTTVLTASARGLAAGPHQIDLKIADTSDGFLDAGVFIRAGSFSVVPEPGPVVLLGLGLTGLIGLGSRGFTGERGTT